MITQEQYFGQKEHTSDQGLTAEALLAKVNALKTEYHEVTGTMPLADPDTGTEISGSKGGSGDGGFRLPNAATGKPMSAHKRAHAVDCFDPRDGFDRWLDGFEGADGYNSKLEEYGLYREHPDDTPGWCHLQDVAPGSKRRTFKP